MKAKLPWADALPEHWDVRRGDQMARRVRRPPRGFDGTVTAFRDGQVTLRTNRRVDGFTEAMLEIGYQGIRRGDLVIHSMDAFAGAIGVSDSDGKSSPVVHAYIGTRGDPRFLAYCLRTAARSGYIESLAKGIRERSTAFDAPTFKYMLLPAPPQREQVAIADFLDRETAKIDALIEKQSSLAADLLARRDATIGQLTTSGASGTVPVSKPGHPWFDRVPTEWRLHRIGHRYEVVLGKMLDAGRAASDGDFIAPYVRAASIQREGLDLDDVKEMPFSAEELLRLSLRAGDLLVVEGGASVGVSVCLGGDLPGHGFQKTVNRLRARGADSPRYLHYVFRWMRATGLMDLICDGSTIPHLTAEKIRAIVVPFPPVDVQNAIADELDRIVATTNSLIATVDRSIDLARERRSALIMAAVTGQFDIGTAA